MISLSCPACGAPVEFKSAAPYAVCGHCQSLLIRRDASLESLGKVAQVPQDFSPLQLHTGGVFEGHRFTLIGRIRKAWAEGSWSEWCAQLDDQRMGWLAEAQGDLVMLFERPPSDFASPPTYDWLSHCKGGETLPLQGRHFTVTDAKKVVCLGAEGELTSAVAMNTPLLSVDLHGPGLELATIEISGRKTDLFMGRYVEFDACRFTNLRTLEGWKR